MTRGLLLAVACCSFFSIALMQMLLGLSFLSFLMGIRRWGKEGVRGPLTLLMGGFILISLLSALNAGDAHAAKKALSGGMPLLVYWMVLNVHTRPEHLTWSMPFIVSAAVAAALFGLVQAWSESTGFRISGSLSHYMTYSGVLMMATCCALSGLVFHRGRRWLSALALVPLLSALLLTQTRGAWVGLIAGGLVVLALRRARLVFALPVLAIGCYFLAPTHVQDRIRSTVELEDTTANERLVMWGIGLRMIEDHPLLGVGPRRADELYDQYRPAGDPFADVKAPGHLHNNLIQLTATRGLLGGGVWVWLWAAWFVLVSRRYWKLDSSRELERVAVVGSLAALTAFQVMGLFEFNAGDSEVATLAMSLAGLGCASATGIPAGVEASSIKSPPRGPLIRAGEGLE